VTLRCDDCNGNALLVDRPAAMAYDAAYRISPRDGAMLWRAGFDETQKPCSTTYRSWVLSAGRGVWQTGKTLTRIGLQRVIETFPGIAPSALP